MQQRGELGSCSNVDALALGLVAATQGGLLLTRTPRSTAPLEAAIDLAPHDIRVRLQSPVGAVRAGSRSRRGNEDPEP